MITPTDDLRAFESIIGRWKTPGTVFDQEGYAIETIAGTDEYEWTEGSHWVIHRIDVTLADQEPEGLELIGDRDADTGRYVMRAFDASGSFRTMAALPQADGSRLLEGAGLQAFLTPSAAGRVAMTARWERQAGAGAGEWIQWMDVRFDPAGS